MTRFRQVKKYGNTFVISLTTYDMEDLHLSVGDEVDIEGIVIKKKEKTNGKRRTG